MIPDMHLYQPPPDAQPQQSKKVSKYALYFSFFLVWTAILFLIRCMTAAPASGDFLIVGATVVNVYAHNEQEALRPNMTLVIRGDRLADIRETTTEEMDVVSRTAAGPSIKNSAAPEIIDARSLYVIPGLIDTHVHLKWNGKEAAMLRILLANGVTSILEAGNPSPKVYVWRRQSLTRTFVGPRMEVCGPIITASPAAWPGMTVVSTALQLTPVVRARARAGARFIKIYAQLPPALSLQAIKEAHMRGMRVMGHLGRTNALEATAFGINIITHLSGIPDSALPGQETVRAQHALGFSQGWQATNAAWPQADSSRLNELIRHMVTNHVALSPTLWFQKVFATLGEDTPEKQEAVRYSHAPKEILQGWTHFQMDVGDPQIFQRAWPYQVNFVKAFYQAGGTLITGTDTPNQFVAPGFSLHQEMETLAETGIPSLDVLRAATVNASRVLGHEEEYGSIEIGNRADLLLLEANPLSDIKNVRRIRYVIRGGISYTPTELLAGLPK